MASDSHHHAHPQRAVEREELIHLLCRALSRLAVAASGVDRRLDRMLVDLRVLLRRDIDDPAELVDLIDDIDKRIKLVDDERDLRSEMVRRALQQMVEQLLALRPQSGLGVELKLLLRDLKGKAGDGDEVELLVRLPELQQQVLQSGREPRGGMLSRWFGGASRREEPPEPLADDPDEASHGDVSPDAVPGDPTREEPSFARISTAVCDVLNNLLRQIEPPPTATDNYQHAREQIERGLNWYELVSTLEEISLVVLAALERGQGDFQAFLLTLNNRLEQAHNALQSSRAHHDDRTRDDASLNSAVRNEVAEIHAQVAAATQLEVLKSEVKERLGTIVLAMDHHHAAEQSRQSELERELAVVTERLKEVESHARLVEQTLVEQQRLALIDALTQLPNRKAYEMRLDQEFERWRRYRHPLVLAVLDIDHFKAINDNYGHLAGDKVLRIMAKMLRTRLRKTDFIGRYGGEEFVVLMPETPLEAALQTLQAMCGAVAESPFHFRAQPVSITLSGGVAEFVDDVPVETVFERADAALYRAKAGGRNRVVVA